MTAPFLLFSSGDDRRSPRRTTSKKCSVREREPASAARRPNSSSSSALKSPERSSLMVRGAFIPEIWIINYINMDLIKKNFRFQE